MEKHEIIYNRLCETECEKIYAGVIIPASRALIWILGKLIPGKIL